MWRATLCRVRPTVRRPRRSVALQDAVAALVGAPLPVKIQEVAGSGAGGLVDGAQGNARFFRDG